MKDATKVAHGIVNMHYDLQQRFPCLANEIALAITEAVEKERERFKDMMGRYETMLTFKDSQRQRFAYEMREQLSFYLDHPELYKQTIESNEHPFKAHDRWAE